MILSIVIANYNTKSLLGKCLESIFGNPPSAEFEVVVVDNGSSDGSLILVRQKYPQVILIELKENLGFSKANNIGIKESKGGYILLLNTDTIIYPQTLDKLLNFASEKSKLGAVGPKLINSDGSWQNSCFDFPTISKTFLHLCNLSSFLKKLPDLNSFRKIQRFFRWHHFAYQLQRDIIQEIDFLLFACVLIPREVFHKVGYLDESLFFYHEDCEFGYRVRECGLKTYYFPFATVLHKGGGSTLSDTGKLLKNYFLSLLRVYKKHNPYAKFLILKITILVGLLWRIFFLPFSGGTDFKIPSRYKNFSPLSYSFSLIANAFDGYLRTFKACLWS